MALQTLTASSSSTDISPTSTSSGTNSGGSSGLLGSDGATPLIPAFLLAGLLAIGILTLLWYRRARAGPFGAQGDAALGPFGSGFYYGRGLVHARIPGALWREDMEERRERPRMWDVLLESPWKGNGKKEMEANGEEGLKWSCMKPLSASFIPASPPSKRSVEPQQHPLAGRWVFNWGLPSGHPSTRPPEPPASDADTPPDHNSERRLRVNVLVAMPQQKRGDVHGVEEKEEVGELDVVLGVAEVSFVESGDGGLETSLDPTPTIAPNSPGVHTPEAS